MYGCADIMLVSSPSIAPHPLPSRPDRDCRHLRPAADRRGPWYLCPTLRSRLRQPAPPSRGGSRSRPQPPAPLSRGGSLSCPRPPAPLSRGGSPSHPRPPAPPSCCGSSSRPRPPAPPSRDGSPSRPRPPAPPSRSGSPSRVHRLRLATEPSMGFVAPLTTFSGGHDAMIFFVAGYASEALGADALAGVAAVAAARFLASMPRRAPPPLPLPVLPPPPVPAAFGAAAGGLASTAQPGSFPEVAGEDQI